VSLIMHNSGKTWQVKTPFLLVCLFGVIFATMLFLQSTLPIYDPDFWWHLKTGETIVQGGELLQSDPFSFHEPNGESAREKIILRGYWLWQVAAYNLYSLLGLNGVLLLKFFTIVAMVTTLVLQFCRQRISVGLAAPLLVVGFWLTSNFPLERPQAVSFLFAIILVGFLTSVRRGGRLGLSLPIMMCLWANAHNGFVFGDLILLCFAVGVVAEYRHDLPKMKNLLVWTCAGVAASLVNPNGGAVFLELFSFQGSNMMHRVLEFQSTWISFEGGRHVYALLWLLIALYFVAVVILRQCYWPELLISAFLAYASVSYTRNVPFFALAMLPSIGWSWREVLQRWRFSGSQIVGLISTSFAILMSLWLAQSYWKSSEPGEKMRMFYPVEAADFLDKSGLHGRVFNDYGFGGYLLWRLSPEFKFFIDGRALSPDIFEDYHRINNASAKATIGQSDYLTLINSYKIEYVLNPIYDPYTGNVLPLMIRLLERPEWTPIYLDKKVYVLARLSEDNQTTFKVERIEKDEFKKRLLLIYGSLQQNNPQQVRFRVARAGLLIYMGNYEAAKSDVDAIVAMAPNHSSLPSLQRALQVLAWRRTRSLN
jgi:hypothetical protein